MILKTLFAFPVGAAIAAASAIGSTGLQLGVTGKMNKKTRHFSEYMYDKQRRDNLSDWRSQNEYNSPQAQMARLQAAGLNPALIYGSSSGGAAGQADKIQHTDMQMPQFRVPDVSGLQKGIMSAIDQYSDFEIKQAQIDNLKSQNSVLEAERLVKLSNAARLNFDLDFDTELREVSADARRESLRKLKADTSFTLSENERKELMNTSNLNEALERILASRSKRATDEKERKKIDEQLKNLKEDTALKKLDRELWKAGITRNDPLWMRIIVRNVQKYLEGGINPFKFKF